MLVRQLLHEVIDLVIDVANRGFDVARGVVREAPLRADHVENLVGCEQDVGKSVEHTLTEGQLHRYNGIEVQRFV